MEVVDRKKVTSGIYQESVLAPTKNVFSRMIPV